MAIICLEKSISLADLFFLGKQSCPCGLQKRIKYDLAYPFFLESQDRRPLWPYLFSLNKSKKECEELLQQIDFYLIQIRKYNSEQQSYSGSQLCSTQSAECSYSFQFDVRYAFVLSLSCFSFFTNLPAAFLLMALLPELKKIQWTTLPAGHKVQVRLQQMSRSGQYFIDKWSELISRRNDSLEHHLLRMSPFI